MFKKIPGSATYSATLGGKIRNDDTGCEPIINNDKMLIAIYGKEYVVSVGWLGLIAHYEIYLPEALYEFLVKIEFVPFNPRLTKSIACEIPIYPEEMKANNSRIVPCFSDYSITCDGIVTEVSSGRIIIPQKVSDNGYPYVFIYNPDRNTKMEIMVHRLVALAWHDNDDYVTKPLVNHLDGIKVNYHYTNLEWTSYSDNQLHACDTGLVDSTIPCKLRDVVTGDIVLFKSLSHAYRHMGATATPRSDIFKSCKLGNLLLDRYEIKPLNDSSEWFHKLYATVGTAQHVVHVTSNGYTDHYNLDAFKRTFKIWNVSGVNNILDKARRMYPDYFFDVVSLRPTSIGMQGFNIITKEVIEEPTMSLFSKRTGISKHILQRVVNTGQQRMSGNLLIRQASDDEWNLEFYQPPSIPKRILATKSTSLDSIVFDSLRECAKYFGVDRATIKLRISKMRKLDDWDLKYTE